MGSADSRVTAMRNRYSIIKQVILRNDHFSPSTIPSRDREHLLTVSESPGGTKVLVLTRYHSSDRPSSCLGELERDFCCLGCSGILKKESCVSKITRGVSS